MIQGGLCLLFLPFFIRELTRSGLHQFDLQDLAIWSGLTLFVFAAIALTVNMPEGVSLQYSGAAFLALTLGYSRALLSMTLLLLITQPLATIGQSLLVDALLPIWLMVTVVKLSRQYLPANPFVFLLGCGFVGLFLVYAVQEVVSAAAMALYLGQSIGSLVFAEQTAWSLLLASGEATLEGMITTILVVFLPRAVALFDDEFYLAKPPD